MIVLGDGPDGEVEERAWIEALEDEPIARAQITKTLLAGDGGPVVLGPGRRVWMKSGDDDRWLVSRDDDAREFWEFELVDAEVDV